VTKTDKQFLEMWTVWVDGRAAQTGDDPYEDEEDMAPNDVLQFLWTCGLSKEALNMMRDIGMEYGYTIGELE
jgi:hypothetical protein